MARYSRRRRRRAPTAQLRPKARRPESTATTGAVLLINVDYSKAKERDVTYKLRENGSVRQARAMWGPADIVAVVEAPDHESMRNVICDEIKTLIGVASNTTLYCSRLAPNRPA